uniref:Hypoxia up-regulated protein 1 n=1 Tax=Panagrolaimus davidi TaxID=227884 RepID=A0A914QU64_9BILA
MEKLQEEEYKVKIVGIDLGTTRCCAAVNRNGRIETVALENTGERLLPSYVSFDETTEKCGEIVIKRMRNYSKSTVFDSKRIIGRKFEEIKQHEIQNYKDFQLEILEKNNLLVDVTDCNNTVVQKHPEEISAALLKYIKRKVDEFQGEHLYDVVITVPAGFTESQKTATEVAALIAGWKTVNIMPEPIAAMFAYYIKQPILSNTTMLLFDLGGGTLDISIFRIFNGQIKVLNISGDSNIGGRDFDNLIFDYIKNYLNVFYEMAMPKSKHYNILLQCQNIKEHLSLNEEDAFEIDFEIDDPIDSFIPVTKELFETLSIPLMKRIKDVLNYSLIGSDLKANQINKVLQVGGGCRMPMVKNLLNETFPEAEHCCDGHPEEIVAIGAAYSACFSAATECGLYGPSELSFKEIQRRYSI